MAIQVGTPGNDELIGDSDNILIGRSGDDSLIGVSGNNILIGGFGDDELTTLSSNDVLLAGSGNDTIEASFGGGGNLVLAGTGDDYLFLGAGDRLFGERGNDKFFVIEGGNNKITGGPGADEFFIAIAQLPDAANIITDFSRRDGDRLVIAGLEADFEELAITPEGRNARIALRGADLAVLKNIDANSLSDDDFGFLEGMALL